MSAALVELEPFVDALRVDDAGNLSLAGQPFSLAEAQRLPAGAARLAAELTACVYVNAYSRPFPGPGGDIDAEAGGDLAQVFAAANATPDRVEPGWTITSLEKNGAVVATRYNGRRRLAPGQYMLESAAPWPTVGSSVAAHLPGGSAAHQPGFYYCFSLGLRNFGDYSPLVRIYWNVRLSHAGALVNTVTAALNRYEIPYDFKIATRAADFARTDCAVLYLPQESYRVAMLALAPELPRLAPALSPGVPLFTKRMAAGVGLAEDPGGGESFGMARSRLVANALVECRAGDRFPFRPFADRFRSIAEQQRLDFDALWLNAGSPDLYDLPTAAGPVPVRAAA